MTSRSCVLAVVLALLFPAAARAQATITPEEQRMVDLQLATPKLDPNAMVTIDLTSTPVRDIIDTVAKAGGITVRYHTGVTNLDAPAAAKVSNTTIQEALQTVLTPRGLAFAVTGAKSVFIYPGTDENRAKYASAVRTFSVANANVASLSQTLNQALGSGVLGPDDLRPTIVTLKSSRTIYVRATPDVMAKVAKLIADADKR